MASLTNNFWTRALGPWIAALLFFGYSSAQAADRLFAEQSQLAITLNGPFNTIDRERDKEKEYPGSLSYVDEAGEKVMLDAKFSVRGNFRLRKDVCSHAQLWVNLKKSQVKGTLFAKQDKLKLVVQCKDSDRYAEYLAREQQAYSMFQEVSDMSLATRRLEVTYADSEKGDSRTQLGFFIEHQKRLAKRNDMTIVETPTADKKRLDPAQNAIVAMYMYMVSNTDYSMISSAPGAGCCHNIKVLEAQDASLFPVPYDFDSTGFVATSYAEPSGGLGQSNVKQRLYRGYCLPEPVMEVAINKLRDKRERFYEIISDDPYASKKGVKRATAYIDKFYDVIDNPKKLKREIYDECR
ncbi:MAG: hypothetical protein Cons2KO_12510 [Congregibacter sp.]